MKSFEALKNLFQLAEAEAEKVDRGNKAAGTRLRALMQDLKKGAKEVRDEVQAIKNAGKAA